MVTITSQSSHRGCFCACRIEKVDHFFFQHFPFRAVVSKGKITTGRPGKTMGLAFFQTLFLVDLTDSYVRTLSGIKCCC